MSASASAPVGGNASAQTLSYFGGSGFGLPAITAGTSISNVTGAPRGYSLTPNVSTAFARGSVYGLGARSIGYGGQGESLTYKTTADFQSITLAVKNMYCADCPLIVRKSLEAVPGVSKAVVSYKSTTGIADPQRMKRC